MRTSSVIAASAALVAGANAWGNVTYTTEVVTAYTTYCPKPTQVIHGAKTYTVTKVSSPVGDGLESQVGTRFARAKKKRT